MWLQNATNVLESLTKKMLHGRLVHVSETVTDLPRKRVYCTHLINAVSIKILYMI